MNKLKTFYFLLFTFYFLPIYSFAAGLAFYPEVMTVHKGESFNLNLLLDAEESDINAVEIELEYSSNNLSFISAPTGKSIVSLWIENPHMAGKAIRMAGIMPGGFSGFINTEDSNIGPGVVVSLVFRPTSLGTGNVRVKSAKVILNDGRGTLAHTTFSSATISVIKSEGEIATSSAKLFSYNDSEPPDVFIPSIVKSEHLFDGKYTLVFHTNDDISGVEHYEVREGEDGEYSRADSPYLLVDQGLTGIIYVSAIDFAGNARIVSFDPRDASTTSIKSVGSLVLALLIIVSIVLLILWLIKKRNSYN